MSKRKSSRSPTKKTNHISNETKRNETNNSTRIDVFLEIIMGNTTTSTNTNDEDESSTKIKGKHQPLNSLEEYGYCFLSKTDRIDFLLKR